MNLHLDLSFAVTAGRCAKGHDHRQIVVNLRNADGARLGILCLSEQDEPPGIAHMQMELRYATSGNRDGDQLPDWIFQDPRSSSELRYESQ